MDQLFITALAATTARANLPPQNSPHRDPVDKAVIPLAAVAATLLTAQEAETLSGWQF